MRNRDQSSNAVIYLERPKFQNRFTVPGVDPKNRVVPAFLKLLMWPEIMALGIAGASGGL